MTYRSDNPDVTPDVLRERLEGTFPGDLGIEPLEITKERSQGRLLVDQRHLHPGGYVHGGVWAAFADTVAAWGTWRNLTAGSDFTTIEMKLNVFAAGRPGADDARRPPIAPGHALHSPPTARYRCPPGMFP